MRGGIRKRHLRQQERAACPMCTLLPAAPAEVFAAGVALGAAMANYARPTNFCSNHWPLVTGQLALVGLEVGPQQAAPAAAPADPEGEASVADGELTAEAVARGLGVPEAILRTAAPVKSALENAVGKVVLAKACDASPAASATARCVGNRPHSWVPFDGRERCLWCRLTRHAKGATP